MAIQLISGNLNTYGGNGGFEPDRSTWGYGDSAYFEHTRSILQTFEGTYSAKVRMKLASFSDSEPFTYIRIVEPVASKKYLIRARIFVPSTELLMPTTNNPFFKIRTTFDLTPSVTVLEEVTKTVADCTDSWQEISVKFTGLNQAIGPYQTTFIQVLSGVGFNVNGLVFIDKVECYEYEEVPLPPCLLSITATVTDETGTGLNNGSITVNIVAGDAPYEYRLNGGAWINTNQFFGLAPNAYTVEAREVDTPSCTQLLNVYVNQFGTPVTFTVAVTNETISGAANGTIAVTVTGGTAPFAFSKDAGAAYQSSNLLSNLSPGVYSVRVRDSLGFFRTLQVIVLPGIVVFDKVFFSKNPIVQKVGAIAAWRAEDNYRLFIDVRVRNEITGVYESKLKYPLVPDINDEADFYLGEAFRNSLTANPPLPNDSNLIKCVDRIAFFKTFTGSIVEDEAEPASYNEHTPNLVVLGGVSKRVFPSLEYFSAFLPTNKKFLSWAPVVKNVGINQEDYLLFFCYPISVSTLKLQAVAYYDDATSETEIVKTVSGVVYGNLYQLPCGTSNSGVLQINPAKKLVKYELSLLNQSDVLISEVRTFLVDAFEHPLTRYFMFLNSLGGYEVIKFNGLKTVSSDYDREVLEYFLPANYKAEDGQFKSGRVSLQDKNSYSTGYITGSLSAEWVEYLKDLLLSKNVFDVTNGNRLPVLITNTTYAAGGDQEYERFLRIETISAYRDECFTPDYV